jgi:hypothetical protein
MNSRMIMLNSSLNEQNCQSHEQEKQSQRGATFEPSSNAASRTVIINLIPHS